MPDNRYDFNGQQNTNQNPFDSNYSNQYDGQYDQYSNQQYGGQYDQYGNQQYDQYNNLQQDQYGNQQYSNQQYNQYTNQQYDQYTNQQYDQYNNLQYDQYGNQQYNNQQHGQYGNQPKKGGALKKILILILALSLLGGVAYTAYNKMSKPSQNEEVATPTQSQGVDLPVIYGFNDMQRPVDKNGNVINPQFDENGELYILPITKDVLDRLGISQEEYVNGDFNPFFDEAGRSSKEPVLDLDSKPIYKEDGKPLLKIIGRDILRDPAGDPFLNSKGEVWYLDDPRLPSKEVVEAETGLKYDMIGSNIQNQGATANVKEEDKSVANLEQEFFNQNSDDSKIAETPWRDMGLIPDSDSKNKFIVYNCRGILAPYDDRTYINRELFGRLFNYDYFSNTLNHGIEELSTVYNIQKSDKSPVVALNITLNKERVKDVVKTLLNELRQKNWYPDLASKPIDRVVTDTTSWVSKFAYNVETTKQMYTPPRWTGVNSKEGTYERWFEQKVEDSIEILNKVNSRTMNSEQLAKLHYDIYIRLRDDRLKYYKEEACKEMNNFSRGSCPSSADLSTLEIRSDFIEMIYKYAYEKSMEDYIKAAYMIHSEIRNPANKLSLVPKE